MNYYSCENDQYATIIHFMGHSILQCNAHNFTFHLQCDDRQTGKLMIDRTIDRIIDR